jgi:phosphate transport system permease protein
VFPASVGTVLMTLIMAILVVPFGVTAALYLREYARGGAIVSAVRIAINNLAGVPSIVFGVFGLGFFCYGVGDFIDGGPQWEMPRPAWFLLLAGLVAMSFGAFLTMLAGAVRPREEASLFKKFMRYLSRVLWLSTAAGALLLIATTPFFHGFFRASLPNPTFGKGALVWASFTLALLTLPVVIVATEEALSAVPNSMREGSYACGASKWQTIKRIVLPRAMPGIMTGMILAMARGAGEVAPLMLVGAVKLAPKLPISFDPGENFGISRSFMHLGFHIYDLGFQSQNSEAAKPLVFTTTLLLIAIVATLNIAAIGLRSRLKKKFVGTQF